MGARMCRSWARGLVHAGTARIEYVCCGRGAPLLLLSLGPARDLGDALSSHYRVIAPRVPPTLTASELGAWLGALIDGLGLARPRIVTLGQLANLTRSACADIDQIESLCAKPGPDDISALLTRLRL